MATTRLAEGGREQQRAGQGHANGLTRLRWEGVEMLSAKELYYEWLRDLPTVRALNAKHPELVDPPGFSL